jgi:mxaJ protein
MSSRFLRISLALGALWGVSLAAEARDLRVCADPNNLPYSDAKGAGFENKIAQVEAANWFPASRARVP